MDNRLILTDVDDTCLDFSNEFEAYVRANTGHQPEVRLRDIYMLDTFLKASKEEAADVLDRFILDRGHDQPAEPCANTVIPSLYGAGYRFVAITACGLDPVFRLKRTRNLRNAFGFAFEDVHVVDFGAEKAPILELYPKAIWVEDHFGHAVAGAEIGHTTFLLDRPHNRDRNHPLVTRVKDWHEIADRLGTNSFR